MKVLLQYDYAELLAELLSDIFDPLQPKIAYGKYIQVVREKDVSGTYKAIVDYYLLDKDLQEYLRDNVEWIDDYNNNKDKLKIMLVDDIVKEMKEFIEGKEIEVNI